MIKILWADDQINVVKTLSDLLSPLNPEIDFFDDCESVLNNLKNEYYDILILDLMMPPGEWGGLWLLKNINDLKIHIPTLILSGEGTQTETIKALRLGANDYVTKDNVQEELLKRVFKLNENSTFNYPIVNIIQHGESEIIEFKSTLRWNLYTNKVDKNIEFSVLKTIAAFLNSNGGTLIIGVNDEGIPLGIKNDNFKNEDKMNLHLINLIKKSISNKHCEFIKTKFEKIHEHSVLRADVTKSNSPAFIKDKNKEYFFIRTGPATTNLPVSEIHEYITKRFKF